MPAPLGPKHAQVQRLRALLRDPKVRAAEQAVVLEGVRAVRDAVDRGIALEAVYVPEEASPPDGLPGAVPVERLKAGLLERIATTRTPQSVLATAPRPAPVAVGELPVDGCVLVLAGIGDPGNVGTLLRAAEAAGAMGVVVGPGTADVFAPKVVRASAGAIFGLRIVLAADLAAALGSLGAGGRRRYGTVATGGTPYTAAALDGPIVLVLGNEAHGLPADLESTLDELLTIPMAGGAESLNVAMAGTVLLFAAARRS